MSTKIIELQPVVHVRDGNVFANSRDVAEFFGKRHDHIVRDIGNLLSQGVPNFGETPYIEPQNGQTYRSYDMDRDGFMLLAMAFTGATALQWKLRYIAAFNAMEKELKRPQKAIGRAPTRDELSYLRLVASNFGPDGLVNVLRDLGIADMSGLTARQPASPPATARIASTDDIACLKTLLEFKTAGEAIGSIMARAVVEGPDSKRLRNYGIRLFEHENVQGFVFWTYATRITRVFAGSRWPKREWEQAILRIPGTAAVDLLKASNSNIATRMEIFVPRFLLAELGYG